jgi:2-dehydropantoate 2-reductase
VTQFLVMQTPEGDIIPTIHGNGQTAFGELTGERSARCEALLTALAAGGIPCTLSENIVGEMWTKFCGAAASFAIAAVIRARADEVVGAPAGAGFVAAAFDECARVAAAEGYPPPAWLRDLLLQIWSQPGSNYGPSLLADIENGRPTEGEWTCTTYSSPVCTGAPEIICGRSPPAKDVEFGFGEMVGCSHMSGPSVRFL